MNNVNTLPQVSGIYYIKNTHNNKLYIGSTINLQQRLYKHRALLRHNKHENRYLQNSWNKYGESNFACGILTLCLITELLKKEQINIQKLKPEFNLMREVLRRRLSKLSIKKLTKTLIQGYKSGRIVSKTRKKVHQYTLAGTYIKTFPSIEQAAISVKCNRSTIDRAIHSQKDKTIKTGKGYQWRLIKEATLSAIAVYPCGQRKRKRRTKAELQSARKTGRIAGKA